MNATLSLLSLAQWLEQTPYASYAYSYPHKTAYRPLEPSVSLRDVWAWERRDALFLYLHVPFCEMRCGFCNLFTSVQHRSEGEIEYSNALERQARRVREALGAATFARLAIGGGTPTFLPPAGLHRLFDIAENIFECDPHAVPVSVEVSPLTATSEKLAVLHERGADRISIGVQSFLEEEVQAAGRPQKTSDVEAALRRIRDMGCPTLNIDLMYGLPGQTIQSWLFSLERALHFAPEEIYLYPLYVRPLTGISRRNLLPQADIRLECYRVARDLLLSRGYRQVSMRMFQAARSTSNAGPVYCCQQDGLIGLGCGARSYTQSLHYSTEYAVGASGVRDIIADYIARSDTAFDFADYGFQLDEEEQRRRSLLQSLLQVEGLNFQQYRGQFGSDVWQDVPQLNELVECGLAERTADTLRLNAAGIEYSDVIGPWLASNVVRRKMAAFSLQ